MSWSNPGNIASSNDSYATADLDGVGAKSHWLRAGGFDLDALPDDALIRGVVVSVERRSSHANATMEVSVTLVKEDELVFADRATAALVPTTDTVTAYGGTDDVWNENFPTPNLYKAANFGVLLAYENGESAPSNSIAVISVDHVEVTIYYDEAPDCGEPTAGTAWADSSDSKGAWSDDGEAAGAPDGFGASRTVTSSGYSGYLFCSDFDLDTIPSNHIITGVQVTIVAKVSGTCQKWHYVECWDGNMSVSRGKWPFVEPTGGEFTNFPLGHCEDLWPYPQEPENWFTPAMFNNQTFYVAIQFWKMPSGTNATFEVDAVSVSVWHEAP